MKTFLIKRGHAEFITMNPLAYKGVKCQQDWEKIPNSAFIGVSSGFGGTACSDFRCSPTCLYLCVNQSAFTGTVNGLEELKLYKTRNWFCESYKSFAMFPQCYIPKKGWKCRRRLLEATPAIMLLISFRENRKKISNLSPGLPSVHQKQRLRSVASDILIRILQGSKKVFKMSEGYCPKPIWIPNPGYIPW